MVQACQFIHVPMTIRGKKEPKNFFDNHIKLSHATFLKRKNIQISLVFVAYESMIIRILIQKIFYNK